MAPTIHVIHQLERLKTILAPRFFVDCDLNLCDFLDIVQRIKRAVTVWNNCLNYYQVHFS